MKTITIDGKDIQISDKSYAEFKKQFVDTGGRWKPEINEKYWFIFSGGSFDVKQWRATADDKFRWSTGNCSQTKEEAEAYKQRLIAEQKIRDSSDFVPDWSHSDQTKYYVSYDHYDQELTVFWTTGCQDSTVTYYRTVGEAEQAIKDLEAEYLLVLGVSDE